MTPTRGRSARPGLDRPTVLRAALTIIDAEGLDALSMRRLASDLGVEAMSLYHWVPSKDALLDGVVEEIAAGYPTTDRDSDDPWEVQLAGYLGELRAVLLAHPNAVGLVASRPIMTERTVEVAEQALGALTGVGLAPPKAGAVLHVLHTFVLGHVLGQVGETGMTTGRDLGEIWSFRRGVSEERYPLFRAALAVEPDPDAEFEMGVGLLLNGLAAEVQVHARVTH